MVVELSDKKGESLLGVYNLRFHSQGLCLDFAGLGQFLSQSFLDSLQSVSQQGLLLL